jgi:hypothetical protein
LKKQERLQGIDREVDGEQSSRSKETSNIMQMKWTEETLLSHQQSNEADKRPTLLTLNGAFSSFRPGKGIFHDQKATGGAILELQKHIDRFKSLHRV